MENTKHTPGPWKVARTKGGIPEIWDENGPIFFPSRYHPNHETYAHIAAAAPDMLAALKDAFQLLDGGYGEPDKEPLEIIAAVREAIAKAEGK